MVTEVVSKEMKVIRSLFSRIFWPRLGAAGIALGAAIFAGPSFGQVDLGGSWAGITHEDATDRGNGPVPVDYLGLALNEDGRAKALSYSISQLSMIERQCVYYPPNYHVMGPFGFRMIPQTEPLNGNTIAWNISGTNDRAPMTVWMDGRPHPPKEAPHPVAGFTTGKWEGDVLVTYTTHIKAGMHRRNGAPLSDQATITTRFIRHGDLLTLVMRVDDPPYLTEADVISRNYRWALNAMRFVDTPCVSGEEGTHPEGVVPHFLPGQNPFVDELTTKFHIPVEATLGGAATMYPEFRKKMKDTYTMPPPVETPPGRGAQR